MTDLAERLTAEPWCKSFDEIANLTDYQIERILTAQSKVIENAQQPTPTAEPQPEMPQPTVEDLRGGSGQWAYLKAQGYSDAEAEAKLRKMRGG